MNKEKQKKDEKNTDLLEKVKKHPLIMVSVCMIIPIVVLQCMYWSLTYYGISWFAEPLSEGDILGFIGDIVGSLIGGLIALYVLRSTIENERTSIEDKNRLSVMPLLLYNIPKQKVVLDTEHSEDIFSTGLKGEKSIQFNLKIYNIGLGPAISLTLGNWNVGILECLSNEEPRSIPKDGSVLVRIKLILPSYDKYDEETGQDMDFSRKLILKNLLGDTYEQEILFRFQRLKYYQGDKQIEREEIVVRGSTEMKLL